MDCERRLPPICRCGPIRSWLRCLLALACLAGPPRAALGDDQPDFSRPLTFFFSRFCNDCHADGAAEGGLDLSTLGSDLNDEAVFERWERIFDRVRLREMPPPDSTRPSAEQLETFARLLGPPLSNAHARAKGTVLRRLNRREYENTINDLLGTRVDLAELLPEDGKSHEFDTVGGALGISLVHLQRYMDAAGVALDAAIADRDEPPAVQQIEASYADTQEGEKFIGQRWKKLSDGAVVRFSGGGYPSGMLRGSRIPETGRYRIRVTGYGHQTDRPLTFSVGGTSFAPGSEKPIYGFWSFPPGRPGETNTVELEAWIDENYMLAIEPYGIADPQRYQRKSIEEYDGPGLAILKVTLEGPLVDQYPSRGHQLIWDGIQRQEIPPRNPRDRERRGYRAQFEVASDDEAADARQSLQRVAAAAFRRPVDGDELTPFVELFSSQRDDGASFEQALRTAVTAVLCSPKFIYLIEPPGPLDDHALASRLSYFLTRSAPDAELRELAAAGQLATDDVLRRQTERLLDDPRLQRFLQDFSDSWLDLRDIDFTIPDERLFPEFDSFLRYSMPLETQAFLHELIRTNLPVRNVVRSDFAMLNSRLAEHYELPPVEGAKLRKTALPEGSVRGGLLTQASILKVTANGTNTSPVTRGAWVMERILNQPSPPPPPGIPGVEPDIRGAQTLRQLLDKHRNLETCNACHQKIDPPGLALEAFNPIGGYRDRYRSLGDGERVEKIVDGRPVRYRLGPPVDASGELPGRGEFDDYSEFRDLLAADQDMLAKSLAAKLLTFASGRELGFSDRAELTRIVAHSRASGHGVRDLIHLVVQSEIFRRK